jgi:cytochrome c-type biogenesis protein CcmH/NrfF
MTLPLAHLGHYLWILYLLPVVFVIIGIAKTTLSEKRREPDDDPGPSSPDPSPDESREEDAPPGA